MHGCCLAYMNEDSAVPSHSGISRIMFENHFHSPYNGGRNGVSWYYTFMMQVFLPFTFFAGATVAGLDVGGTWRLLMLVGQERMKIPIKSQSHDFCGLLATLFDTFFT